MCSEKSAYGKEGGKEQQRRTYGENTEGSILSLESEDVRQHSSGGETPRIAKVKIKAALLDQGC
jgi:hypothetical protein